MSSEVDPKGLDKRGPDFAFPMEDAPKDGTILRLLVKFDHKSSAGPFEDTDEPSWTIGANNEANTGEDQWDVVGWSWEQDVFCSAYGTKVLGWLPFHAENSVSAALPSPASPSIGRVGALEQAARAGWEKGRRSWCPASVLEDQERTERDWAMARPSILSALVYHEEPAGDTQGASVADETQWVLVPREPTEAMLSAAMDDLDWWQGPTEVSTSSENAKYDDMSKATIADAYRAMLSASPAALVSPPDNGGWMPIETAPKDKSAVLIAVPTKDCDGFHVGEAYFDPENYGDGDWWWAGTGYGDYHGGPISDVNHHAPLYWQPLPSPPALQSHNEGSDGK